MMIILIVLTFPTILFYLMLNVNNIYKLLLSILFYIILFIIAELFRNVISNLHYDLTDKIGYNNITDFTRIFSNISDILFVIITTIIMFILYKNLKH